MDMTCIFYFCINVSRWFVDVCRSYLFLGGACFTTCHTKIQAFPDWNQGFLIGLPPCHSVALHLWLAFVSKP